MLNVSFWATPFISDFEDHGIIDLNGEFGGGFWIGKYSVLFNTAIMYESAAEHHNKRHNRCQWTMRENVLFRIEIAKYFALSAQTGLGWQRLSVQSGINDIVNTDYFIFGNRLTANFPLPTKYVSLKLYSDLDCFFAQNDIRLRFDTFFRIDAAVYFDFLHLFSDFGMIYEPNLTHGSDMPYFSYQTGIAIRLRLRQKKISKKIIPVVVPPQPPKPIEEKTHEEKKQQQQENYVELYQKIFDKKNVGDTIELDYIYFMKQNDLSPNALNRLNALSAVLIEKKYVIAIGAYSDSLGDADAEMALAKQRSQHIKDIFIKNGIPAERIKIKANANVYKEDAAHKVIEVKIIK